MPVDSGGNDASVKGSSRKPAPNKLDRAVRFRKVKIVQSSLPVVQQVVGLGLVLYSA